MLKDTNIYLKTNNKGVLKKFEVPTNKMPPFLRTKSATYFHVHLGRKILYRHKKYILLYFTIIYQENIYFVLN